MPTKDINDAVALLRDNWENIKKDYAETNPGKHLVLTCVHRPPSEQFALYQKGRTMGTDGKWYVQDKAKIVTNVDGTDVLGAHNYKPSRAIDVMVVDNSTGRESWDENLYADLVNIAKRYDLESGGSWKSIKDWPHLQVPNYKTYTEA